MTRQISRGAAFGDFDNDGDIDILVMNMNEAPALLRNDYAGPNRWVAVQLEGTRLEPVGHRRDGPCHRRPAVPRRRPCSVNRATTAINDCGSTSVWEP